MNLLTVTDADRLNVRRVQIVQADSLTRIVVRCPAGQQYRLADHNGLSVALSHHARQQRMLDTSDLQGVQLELVPRPVRTSRGLPWRWNVVA
jgi:hypothetical protein